MTKTKEHILTRSKIPSRSFNLLLGTFFRYIFVSLSSFVVDILVFALGTKLLFPALSVRIPLSTAFARIISGAYNYAMNRKIVFKSDRSVVSSGFSYLMLCIIQCAVSAGLVTAICYLLPLDEVPVKAVVDTCLFFVNYKIQKNYIFQKQGDSMKKKNSNICRLFLTLLGLLMAIQICFGFAWMVVNLANIPIFGDSTEYFNLSQTLMVDEYRPLLYPLLIRFAVKVANHLPLAYQTLAYIGQTLLCILSAIFLSVQIGCLLFPNFKKQNSKLFYLGSVFTGLYITCIPMITFMNFSILTDSIATSMLMLMIGALIHILNVDAADWKSYLLVTLSHAGRNIPFEQTDFTPVRCSL